MTSRFGQLLGFLTVAGLPAVSNLSLTYILVRTLPLSHFASWAIVEPLLLILATMGTLGLHMSLLFFNARDEMSPSHLLGAAISLTVPCALFIALAGGWVVSRYADGVGPLALLAPLTGDALGLLVTSTLRGKRQVGAWVTFEVIRSLGLVVLAALSYAMFPYWVRTLDHFLLMRGCLTMMAVVVVCGLLRAFPNGDIALMRRLAAYGVPSSGSSLLGLAINNGDRFLLAAVGAPVTVIASYAAHQRLTGLLGIATITPLQLWFPVEAIRRNPERDRSFFQGATVACLAVLGIISLCAFVAGPLVWPIMFETIPFNPWLFALLGIAVVPRALSITFNIGGLREKKTHHNLWPVIVTGIVMGGIGLPLAPMWHGVGAAAARVTSLWVQALAMLTISQRIAPVRYNLLRMAPFAVALALALFVPSIGSSAAPKLALAASLACTGIGIALNWSVLAGLIFPAKGAS